MDRGQFADVLSEVAAVYGVKPTDHFFNGYIDALDGEGWQECADALRQSAKSLKFMPRPADVLVAIRDAKRDKWRVSTPEEPELSPMDRAVGMDLMPLFQKYLRGETTLDEWVGQMVSVADKHGCGPMMREEIRDCGLNSGGD